MSKVVSPLRNQPPGWKMENRYEGLFEESCSSICVLKSGQKVLYQNQTCKKLCGNHGSNPCPQSCVSSCEKVLGRKIPMEGLHYFSNTKVGNEFFDLFFYHESNYRIVILQSLSPKYDSWLKRFTGRGLSRRELEVVRLGMRGMTNTQITQKLGISRPTLKTHLNNIYKKAPEIRKENWRFLK